MPDAGADWLFLSRRRLSDLNHVLTSDITRVGQGTQVCLNIMVTLFLASVQVAIALALSPVMTAAALATGLLLSFVLRRHIGAAQRLGADVTEANREVFATVGDFLAGLKLARGFGAEALHVARFSRSVDDLRGRMMSFVRRTQGHRLLYQVGAALALGLLLYMAAEVVHLAPARLLVLVLIFARVAPLLLNLQQDLQHFLHMLPAFSEAEALRAACAEAAEPAAAEDTPPPVFNHEIRLEGVRFDYGAGQGAALNGVDLIIPARRMTALVGPSGAGKSTLADILMGMLAPTGGAIFMDGKPLAAAGWQRPWRRTVGYVPQDVFLLNDTLRANLAWAAPEADEAAMGEALARAAADGFVSRLPAGLDEPLGERGVRLSGGERQRIALARALLRAPKVLILDEATSALDAESEGRIHAVLENLRQDITIIVIAHRHSTVRAADRIAVMEEGRIVETGSWDELMTRPGSRLAALVRAEEEKKIC